MQRLGRNVACAGAFLRLFPRCPVSEKEPSPKLGAGYEQVRRSQRGRNGPSFGVGSGKAKWPWQGVATSRFSARNGNRGPTFAEAAPLLVGKSENEVRQVGTVDHNFWHKTWRTSTNLVTVIPPTA